MSKIIIGADLVPTKTNYSAFENGDTESLIGKDLTELLRNADYTIFNLEAPITDSEKPISKCGPNLCIPTSTLKGIKKINPHFFTLANNHILDQGLDGLKDTIKILEKNDISYAGVGNDLEKASKPYFLNIGGLKIAIYCCAEHEFSIATKSSAGANPFDPLESFDHVRKLKANANLVIVLYHGGKEHYRYPSPYLQKIFHKFADSGADFVIAQHTHCIGCEERYGKSLLLYGQGNFIFDHSGNECWNTSILLEITIDDGKITHKYIPLAKTGNGVRAAHGKQGQLILQQFKSRSEAILKEGFIEQEYKKLSNSMLKGYLTAASGKIGRSIIVRALNKITKNKFINQLYDEQCLTALLNYLECEAHRELMIEGIKNRRSK